MAEPQIRFDDGAAYERVMGRWSQLAGHIFLDWLAPAAGLRWLDVGCGNGAFTELLARRCTPATLHGIDPSEGQLAFARQRTWEHPAQFQQGDAMSLPWPADAFDLAVMALVTVFVPVPARGVAEMVRVVRPGGTVAAYMWDMLGGGFPMEAMKVELRALGVTPPLPPSIDASRLDVIRALWTGAGLEDVETTEITVERVFADFADFWASQMSASIAPTLAGMSAGDVTRLRAALQARFPVDGAGRITCSARANAVKGRVAHPD